MWSRIRKEMNHTHERRLPFRGSILAFVAIALVAFCSLSLLAQGLPVPPGPQSGPYGPQTTITIDGAADPVPSRPPVPQQLPVIAPGTGRIFPDTTSRIIPFSDQVGDGALTTYTPAQIQFFATHFAGDQKMTTAAADTLRSYNPDFIILHYRLGEMMGYGTCDTNGNPTANNPVGIFDVTYIPEYTTVSPLKNNYFYPYQGAPKEYACGPQHYLMNIADPGWRAVYSKAVIKEIQDNKDDAVFADTFSVPDYLGETWTPINFSFSVWLTPQPPPNLETQWSGMIHSFTNYMEARFQRRWLWIPNVGSWVTSRDITDYTNVDGAMIEDFADYGNARFLATSDWMLQMDRALSLVNLNKVMIMQMYPAPYGNTTYGLPERLFDTGSYLLVKGSHTYLNLDGLGETIQWWPEYDIDLGPPIDPLPTNNDITKFYNANWGVYVRHYAHGMVLVNPKNSNSSNPITLDKTYYEVIGDVGTSADALVPANGIPDSGNKLVYQAVAGLTLNPDTAAILLDQPPPSPPPVPPPLPPIRPLPVPPSTTTVN